MLFFLFTSYDDGYMSPEELTTCLAIVITLMLLGLWVGLEHGNRFTTVTIQDVAFRSSNLLAYLKDNISELSPSAEEDLPIAPASSFSVGAGNPERTSVSGVLDNTPAKSSSTSHAGRHHLETRWKELEKTYSYLSQRIAVISDDIDREMDSDRKLTLTHRRDGLAEDREEVAAQMSQIELQLKPNTEI